jgi:hypothetical protein
MPEPFKKSIRVIATLDLHGSQEPAEDFAAFAVDYVRRVIEDGQSRLNVEAERGERMTITNLVIRPQEGGGCAPAPQTFMGLLRQVLSRLRK